MVTAPDMGKFKSPDGDVVEATSHEFVTRLKHIGYTRVLEEESAEAQAPNQDELAEDNPQVEHEAVEASTPEQSPEKVSEDQLRRRRDRD